MVTNSRGLYLSFFLFPFEELYLQDLPCSSDSKESACNAGDLGSIPGSGRSFREENSNPLQDSCLKNPVDRGAWWATVRGVARVRHNLTTKQQSQIVSLQQENLNGASRNFAVGIFLCGTYSSWNGLSEDRQHHLLWALLQPLTVDEPGCSVPTGAHTTGCYSGNITA